MRVITSLGDFSKSKRIDRMCAAVLNLPVVFPPIHVKGASHVPLSEGLNFDASTCTFVICTRLPPATYTRAGRRFLDLF